MATFRNLILASAAAAALMAGVAGSASAALLTVTMNPEATNTGVTGGSQLSATDAAFNTTAVQFGYSSLLDINGKVGDVGTETFTESVAIWWISAGLQNHGLTQNYDIYGTATLSGSGSWGTCAGAQTFCVTGLDSLAFNLYGSPGGPGPSGSGFLFSVPTTSTASTLAQFGITAGSADFLLGTGDLAGVGTQPTATDLQNGTGSLSLDAFLKFVPAAGSNGPTGFFQSPVLPYFLIEANPTATTLQTTVTGQTIFQVGDCGGGNNFACTNLGAGSLVFLPVPEPTSLALFGAGLLGLYGAARRKRRKA